SCGRPNPPSRRPTANLHLRRCRLALMRVVLLSAFLLGVSFSAACSRSTPPEFQPTATVKDIMDSVVDPNADAIWDSVEIVATLQGIEEKAPRTDEEWKDLRRHAISLLEASNLLLVPGRQVAKPGEKAEDERVDLKPEEIADRVKNDPGA